MVVGWIYLDRPEGSLGGEVVTTDILLLGRSQGRLLCLVDDFQFMAQVTYPRHLSNLVALLWKG
jgi:hypothetical protein